MSLAPSEQQTLAEIESRLRWSDPKLAARLALFRRRAFGRPGPARELMSPWRSRHSRAARILLLAVAIAVALLGLALADHGGQPHGAAAAICVITAAWHRSRPACSPASPAGSLDPAASTYPA